MGPAQAPAVPIVIPGLQEAIAQILTVCTSLAQAVSVQTAPATSQAEGGTQTPTARTLEQTCRAKLHRRFEKLCQDDMSVTQYEMRFLELARHAIWLVPIDRERIRTFIDGLYYQYPFVMTRESVSGATFDELVDIVWRLEMVHSHEREERKAKMPRGSGGFSGVPSKGQSYHSRGRPYRPTQIARLAHRGVSSSHGLYSARSGQSSLSAFPAQSSSHAPSVQGSSAPGSSGSYSGSRITPQYLPPFFERGCFECRELGHVKKFCPHLMGGPAH
ncbi:uncharacterized protein [Nicotiana tomentosiformis]|uniref:uncharacterized protein n=1 Tax=Nicotiana tomentosiformis TaxID=4098 RepID=UPI00388C8F0B